jgi:hypothetical protein
MVIRGFDVLTSTPSLVRAIGSLQCCQQGIVPPARRIFVPADKIYCDRRAIRLVYQLGAEGCMMMLDIERPSPAAHILLAKALQQARPEGIHQHNRHSVQQAGSSSRRHTLSHVVQKGSSQQIGIIISLLLQGAKHDHRVLPILAGHSPE